MSARCAGSPGGAAVFAVLGVGIAAGIWLTGCSAGAPPPQSFEIRPVLAWQPGSCEGRSGGMPGISGGCYRLAARLGVTVPRTQQAVVVSDPAGVVAVLIVIGPDRWSAFQRMMQTQPGHGKVLAAFPALYGSGPPGTPVRLRGRRPDAGGGQRSGPPPRHGTWLTGRTMSP